MTLPPSPFDRALTDRALAPCGAPLVIAHRGFSAQAPENTIAAVAAAIEVGADGVEIDVQRTADGQLVVVHDRTLRRTTDIDRVLPHRADEPVGSLLFEEVRRCDAGRWKHPTYAGALVPTLTEVLDVLRPSGLALLLELKHPELYLGIEAEVATVLTAHPMGRRTTVQSFGADALHRLARVAPELPRALLVKTAPRRPDPLAWADAVHPWHGSLSSAYVRRAQLTGLRTYAWTVNDAHAMLRLADMGVDALITDRPLRALTALDRRARVLA